MNEIGIVICSHVEKIAEGIYELLEEVSGDVSITFSGGTDQGDVGSSFEKTFKAVEENQGKVLLCFYDLGSAKMTLETVLEMSDKKAYLLDTALIESVFTATVLANANVGIKEILSQLKPLEIK